MTNKKHKSSQTFKNELENQETIEERDIDLDSVKKEDDLEKEIKELKEKNKKLEQEAKENKEKYLMALADMENFKKRTSKERADYLKYQGEAILCDIIEVLDNLDRALESANQENVTEESLKEGVKMIHKQFVDVLSKWGVKSEESVGKTFDPQKHSALSKAPSNDAKENEIISEFKKLYYYKDKILRHAQVVVCSGKIN